MIIKGYNFGVDWKRWLFRVRMPHATIKGPIRWEVLFGPFYIRKVSWQVSEANLKIDKTLVLRGLESPEDSLINYRIFAHIDHENRKIMLRNKAFRDSLIREESPFPRRWERVQEKVYQIELV